MAEIKDCVGVWCACGKILMAATLESYNKDKGTKAEIDAYFNSGHKIGKVSAAEVRELFGCDCKK